MKPEVFYSYVYSVLCDVTPLPEDCGKLCGGACCRESDEGSGMYLYPMEEKMYNPKPAWADISETDFEYGNGKKTLMLTCPDYCDRKLRPLACRIFPLVPYVKRGERPRVILDPRSASLCPLYNKGVDEKFSKGVWRVTKLLYAVPVCREYLYAQTELIDEYLKWRG